MKKSSPPPSYTNPPHYSPPTNHPSPSAPRVLTPGSDTKDIDWSLNRPGSTCPPNAPRYRPASPHCSEIGTNTKGIDWSLNRPPTDKPFHPVYPGGSHNHPHSIQTPGPSSYPAIPNTHVPANNPFHRWREQFRRHYPGSKMSRDNPSVIKVEIPKNRAVPVLGHATCPECFDHGPHTKTIFKRKGGLFSSIKVQTQKCRMCYKLVYFVQTSDVDLDDMSVDRPPPYHNQPARITYLDDKEHSLGHGWSDGDKGHGWNPGDEKGHGWST